MNCYRVGCECDDIKKMYCLYKVTEQQQRLIAKIKGNICIVCGSKTVASKYNDLETRLCTSCGTVAKDQVPIKYCLVNSRRVS